MTEEKRVHVMDAHPERFGWRTWHIESDPFRLVSPIHKGKVRTGVRFVESVCPHRKGQFTLADGCACGVYYEPGIAPAVERWRREVERVDGDEVALTFGAAVGAVDVDPVIPDVAMRAPRYAILAILLTRAHPAAGDLRTLYGVNVHQRGIDEAALEHVQGAVRGDLRRTEVDELMATLEAEPVTPDSGHIMDRKPEAFGWRVWRVDDVTGTLRDVDDTKHSILERRTEVGPTYFEAMCARGHATPVPECRCGLAYVTSSLYCAWMLGYAEKAYLEAGWTKRDAHFAATYGWYDGNIVGDPNLGMDTHRSRRHYPMAVCIPPELEHLKPRMGARYGMAVVAGLDQQVFRDIEKLARTKLAGQ